MADTNHHDDDADEALIMPEINPKKKGGRPKGRKRKKVYTSKKPPNSGNSVKYSRKDRPFKGEATGPVLEEEATLEDVVDNVPQFSDDENSDEKDLDDEDSDGEDDDPPPIRHGCPKVDYAESEDDEYELFTPDQLESLSRGEMDNKLQRPRDTNGRVRLSAEDIRSRRMCIYHFFRTLYKCTPEDTGFWDGPKGIAARIAKKMELPPTADLRFIKNTMRDILVFMEKGVEYKGQYAPRADWENYLIPPESYQSQLLADFIEWDFGFSEATNFLNLYREEQGLPHVGRSCVYEAVKKMKPVVTKVGKRQQGNSDPTSSWAIANYRWSVQVLLRMKEITVDKIPTDLWERKDGPLPDYFDPEKLTPIDPKFIAYWDETHKKQRIGKFKNGNNIQYRFKRNADGKVTMDKGGQLQDPGEEYKMKYEQEARMCTGCVMEPRTGEDPSHVQLLHEEHCHQQGLDKDVQNNSSRTPFNSKGQGRCMD